MPCMCTARRISAYGRNLARMYGVPVRRVTVSSETERVEAIIPLHGLR